MAEIIEQGECGDNLTWTLDDEGLLTISGEGEMKDYGYSDSPFRYTEITKVKISHGVTSIGYSAFSGCEALTSIEIPDSVTSIGSSAFSGCKALTSIEIPNSVTSIEEGAFYGCEALTNISIPNSVTSIEKNTFEGCKALTSIEIPNSVTRIENNAFSGCKTLTNIEIPNSVTSIGDLAFSGCKALTDINVADDNANYTSIDGVLYDKGKETLIQCPQAKTSIEIPNSVTTIGKWAFWGCEALTSITIPNRVTSIGGYAFSGCKALTSIEIPNSVTEIEGGAFSGCKALTNISIPNSVTSIGGSAFEGCSALTNIDVAEDNENYDSIDGVLYDKEKKTLIQCPGGKTNIEISNSVTSIESSAFKDCTALTNINISDGNANYASVNGVLYDKEKKTLIRCPQTKTSLEIPNSVTSIESSAFKDCTALTDINVSDGNANYASDNGVLYNKEKKTLIKCPQKKTSIEIPNSVTKIGYVAFLGCKALTSIEIPNSVTSIGNYAFKRCEALTNITIPNSVTSIGNWTFSGCKALEKLRIGSFGGFYGRYFGRRVALRTCKKLTTIEIADGVTTIGDYAFEGCKALTNITIPNSVTSIGFYAFSGCNALTSIEFANPVAMTIYTSLGSNALTLIHETAFDNTNIKNCTLYAPAKTKDAYSKNPVFSEFKEVIIGHGICGENLTWTLDNKGLLTISGEGGMEDYDHNDSHSPFKNNTYIIKIKVIDGVTTIGDSAFAWCEALTNIEIPNSVTKIGYGAFYGCSSLTSIEIPNSVTEIGDSAFWACKALEKAEFASIESLCSISFNNSYSNPLSHAHHLYIDGKEATNIKIPNSVTSIGNYAFRGCQTLTNIKIPNSVTKIGDHAFEGCEALISIEIPNSVTEIGDGAFNGCKALTNINVAEDNANYVSIDGVLYDKEKKTLIKCPQKKTSVEIPNSVTEIGDGAFAECQALKNIHIRSEHPENLRIHEDAFFGTSIENRTLYVPAGTKDAYSKNHVFSKFKEVIMTEIIECGKCGEKLTWTLDNEGILTISGEGGMEDYDHNDSHSPFMDNTYIIKIKVTDGVTTIGDYAFYGCKTLTNIEIPNSVTKIGDHAFQGCEALEKAEFASIESLCSISFNDSYSNPLSYAHHLYIDGKEVTSIEIPNSVTSIGKSAFCGCEALTSIKIPDSLTEIGNFTFYGCKALTNIEIPNSVTSIGDRAFYGCSALTNIEIPNSVTSIGDRAFGGCEARINIDVAEGNANYASIDGVLYDKEKKIIIRCPQTKTSIEIPNSVTSIGLCAFGGCKALTNIEIPNSVTEIGFCAFGGCKALTNIEIPNSVTEIGPGAFYECEALTSIEIPNSVTSIGDRAFYGCSALTNIEIPNSVTSIGDEAFWGCSALTSIEIPNSVTSIGTGAFRECRALTNIEIPNSVTSIGDWAFYGCEALTNIEIPNSVTSIGERAFEGCETLTSVEIPNSVTSIGKMAFWGCKALTNIEIPNSVTEIGGGAFVGCKALANIEIPNSVTSIGLDPFYRCRCQVNVEGKNENYKSENGSLLSKDGNEMIHAYVNSEGKSIAPEGVNTIKKACYGGNIKDIYLPITTVTLEERAFLYAEIENLHIRCENPENLKIHEEAFYKTNIENCTLYVPIGTGYAYRHHPVFSKFKEVKTEK